MADDDASATSTSPVNTAAIPFDLFITRKRTGLTRDDLTFTDASGNLVFRVVDRTLVDANGNLLISTSRNHDGWQGLKGEGKDLIFRVERTFQSHAKKELGVFLVDKDSVNSKSDFIIRGSPFQRSCTIYQGNSIVAQTSLLYKLHSIFVGKRRFRVTIFPGFSDHALVATLVVIFFHGCI